MVELSIGNNVVKMQILEVAYLQKKEIPIILVKPAMQEKEVEVS